MKEVTENTFEKYGISLNHTFKYNLRGLGDKPNIDEACILGDLWDKHYQSPQFSWDACPAHADSMVILGEKLRRLYGIHDKFGYANTGVGVLTMSQNDALFQCLHDAMHKKQQQTKAEDKILAIKNYSVYGVQSNLYAKPLLLKDVHNYRYEILKDATKSVEWDIDGLQQCVPKLGH